VDLKSEVRSILEQLGVPAVWQANASGLQWSSGTGEMIPVRSPITGEVLGEFAASTVADVSRAAESASAAFGTWRMVPAPQRGELVRRIGQRLRELKEPLARLVSIESGKILQEGLGEVQEMIDICDFAVGLSRQLYGLTLASERPGHRMMEQWHPLGPVGVISAFNFPVAVWSWNAMIALVCGDPVIWKPSEKTSLCGMACHAIASGVAADFSAAPPGLLQLVQGRADVGQGIAADRRVPLVSATGSTRMGRSVAVQVAERLGRSLLELGGNNAAIVAPTADLNLVLRGAVFAAFGTCGQRCTSLRRLFVHESLLEQLVGRLTQVASQLPIGDPLEAGTLVGPLVDEAAYTTMLAALTDARAAGGRVWGGERIQTGVPAGGVYVRPAIVQAREPIAPMQRETFAPILYVVPYRELEQAIAWQNDVPQGLSSAIFTSNVREAEWFCSPAGSDCGIANVNIGTSGAEIGGAFGGEKETGGGRESGSDSWKAYMRRVTNTINYSSELPLAQGIRFEI
jgi:aldehyde dehydrogenase (NAD+)